MRRRLPESAARRKLAWRLVEERRARRWVRWVEADEWDGADEEGEAN